MCCVQSSLAARNVTIVSVTDDDEDGFELLPASLTSRVSIGERRSVSESDLSKLLTSIELHDDKQMDNTSKTCFSLYLCVYI